MKYRQWKKSKSISTAWSNQLNRLGINSAVLASFFVNVHFFTHQNWFYSTGISRVEQGSYDSFFDEAVVVNRKILTRLRSICVESILRGSEIRFHAWKQDFNHSLTDLKGYCTKVSITENVWGLQQGFCRSLVRACTKWNDYCWMLIILKYLMLQRQTIRAIYFFQESVFS